jgi:hypothetical protein
MHSATLKFKSHFFLNMPYPIYYLILYTKKRYVMTDKNLKSKFDAKYFISLIVFIPLILAIFYFNNQDDKVFYESFHNEVEEKVNTYLDNIYDVDVGYGSEGFNFNKNVDAYYKMMKMVFVKQERFKKRNNHQVNKE